MAASSTCIASKSMNECSHRHRCFSQVAASFLQQHAAGHWAELLGYAAALDVLAGFAIATHPTQAPEGCAFCRPTFVTASPVRAGSLSSSSMLIMSTRDQNITSLQDITMQHDYLLSQDCSRLFQPAASLLTGTTCGILVTAADLWGPVNIGMAVSRCRAHHICPSCV